MFGTWYAINGFLYFARLRRLVNGGGKFTFQAFRFWQICWWLTVCHGRSMYKDVTSFVPFKMSMWSVHGWPDKDLAGYVWCSVHGSPHSVTLHVEHDELFSDGRSQCPVSHDFTYTHNRRGHKLTASFPCNLPYLLIIPLGSPSFRIVDYLIWFFPATIAPSNRLSSLEAPSWVQFTPIAASWLSEVSSWFWLSYSTNCLALYLD